MADEFDLIARYFTRPSPTSVDLGVGDDAALLRVSNGCQLVVTTDMSVVNTHFFAEAAAFDIGWKAMAVNISDMAAMGALPKWATLAIALPNVDETWLAGFSQGLFACADAFGVALIGGDTTRGPLNISITLLGEVPVGQALRRDGAQVGDDIWVSGVLGQAALWLQAQLRTLSLDTSELPLLAAAMHRPQPRVALGMFLRGIAHSALDISDGLLADLGHLLAASSLGTALGAILDWPAIPKPALRLSQVPITQLQQAVLAGGDDYELCFTAPVSQRATIMDFAQNNGLRLSRIGAVVAQDTVAESKVSGTGICVLDGEQMISFTQAGYEHFAST